MHSGGYNKLMFIDSSPLHEGTADVYFVNYPMPWLLRGTACSTTVAQGQYGFSQLHMLKKSITEKNSKPSLQ